MPYTKCEKCGETVNHPVGEDWVCRCRNKGRIQYPVDGDWFKVCMTKDGIQLFELREVQIKEIIDLKLKPDTECLPIAEIEKTMEKFSVWQSAVELYWMYSHFERIKPSVIAEIGCYNGGTLDVWERFATLAGEKVKKIIAIDINTERIMLRDRLQPVTTILKMNTANSDSPVRFAEALDGHRIDFAFIDGEHIFSYVKGDFELLWPYIRPGGAIAFHDINWAPNEVGKFWHTLGGNVEKYEIRYAFGIGIIYKGVE